MVRSYESLQHACTGINTYPESRSCKPEFECVVTDPLRNGGRVLHGRSPQASATLALELAGHAKTQLLRFLLVVTNHKRWPRVVCEETEIETVYWHSDT